MKTKIYVLLDERFKIRYVGKTGRSLVKRLGEHLAESRREGKSHRRSWIRSLAKKGYLPEVRFLEEVEGNGAREEITWITYFRDLGISLVNETDGGDGATGHKHSVETRHKMSDIHKGKVFSAETRQKLREANRGQVPWILGKHHSLETRQKLREVQLGRKHSVEFCQNLSRARKGSVPWNKGVKGLQVAWNKGKSSSIETRRKMSEAAKGKVPWIMGKKHSMETRQKMSKSRKRWLSENKKAI